MDKEFKNGKTDIDADYIEMIINNFNSSIEKNLDHVYLGYEVINDEEIKEYTIPKKEWNKTLDLILKTAINLEEYELCTSIKNILTHLK